MESKTLLDKLDSCPVGQSGWRKFEDICIEILQHLFVPPLSEPKIQKRTFSGIDRRDAVFPNRNFDQFTTWGKLYQELKARLILFEFKNYNKKGLGKEEVNQTAGYLNENMGRLAILCCNKKPGKAAIIKRNAIFNDRKILILFVTKDQLKEMILIKERGQDPADLIMDMIEEFYLQKE